MRRRRSFSRPRRRVVRRRGAVGRRRRKTSLRPLRIGYRW